MIQDPEDTGLGEQTAIWGDRYANSLEYGCLTCEYTSNLNQLYTLNMCSLLYASYPTVKSFFFKKS